MSEWIAVRKRMPRGDGEVLLLDTAGDMVVGWYDELSGLFYSMTGPIEATHWMHLPEAPGEI